MSVTPKITDKDPDIQLDDVFDLRKRHEAMQCRVAAIQPGDIFEV